MGRVPAGRNQSKISEAGGGGAQGQAGGGAGGRNGKGEAAVIGWSCLLSCAAPRLLPVPEVKVRAEGQAGRGRGGSELPQRIGAAPLLWQHPGRACLPACPPQAAGPDLHPSPVPLGAACHHCGHGGTERGERGPGGPAAVWETFGVGVPPARGEVCPPRLSHPSAAFPGMLGRWCWSHGLGGLLAP